MRHNQLGVVVTADISVYGQVHEENGFRGLDKDTYHVKQGKQTWCVRNVTVIVSLSPEQKYVDLIAITLHAWKKLGFSVHVILVNGAMTTKEQKQRRGQLIAIIQAHASGRDIYHTMINDEGRETGEKRRVTFEEIQATNYTASSLPGISRYLAASLRRFAGTFIILSDIDLVPLGSRAKVYFCTLIQNADPRRVNVDFVYPANKKCEALQHSPAAIGKLSLRARVRCQRVPRFRTCYVSGTGNAFYNVFASGVSGFNKLNYASLEDLVALVYRPESISLAYGQRSHFGSSAKNYVLHGPDKSYDEILFGKLITNTKNCTGSSVMKSNQCMKIAPTLRNHEKGSPMCAEWQLRNPPKDDGNVIRIWLSKCVDVHFGGANWPNIARFGGILKEMTK
eukprot:GEMP01052826.1.p1 GENE.GEMP01052826.1~~GEMP01052826.1.p1  ORF type:complete len:395 (+),score=43.82 GEMP01052826.1:95-1279(+)